jgi:putative membrane protein
LVKDHDKDVAAFKHASMTAADADLKAWAAKTLPTLEEHQQQAKSISAKLHPTGASKAPQRKINKRETGSDRVVARRQSEAASGIPSPN